MAGPLLTVKIQNRAITWRCPAAAPFLSHIFSPRSTLSNHTFVFQRMSHEWQKLCWVIKPALPYFIVLKKANLLKIIWHKNGVWKNPLVNNTFCFCCHTPLIFSLPPTHFPSVLYELTSSRKTSCIGSPECLYPLSTSGPFSSILCTSFFYHFPEKSVWARIKQHVSGESTCSLKTHRSQYHPVSVRTVGIFSLLEPQFPQGRITSTLKSGHEDETRGWTQSPWHRVGSLYAGSYYSEVSVVRVLIITCIYICLSITKAHRPFHQRPLYMYRHKKLFGIKKAQNNGLHFSFFHLVSWQYSEVGPT